MLTHTVGVACRTRARPWNISPACHPCHVMELLVHVQSIVHVVSWQVLTVENQVIVRSSHGPQLIQYLLHRPCEDRIKCFQEMLAGEKDGLAIFGARISRWRVTKLIILMQRLDFQVQGGTLFAEVMNFDDALGKLLLQVLTISSKNKRARQRFRMQMWFTYIE